MDGIRRAIPVVAVLIVGALVMSSCSTGADMKGSLSSRIRAWASASSFATRTAELQRDGRTVARLARENNQKGVRTLCEVMGIDARKANDSLPTPSERLSTMLANAYSAIYKWAISCYVESTEHGSGLSTKERAPERSLLAQLNQAIVAEKALATPGGN